ncbi:hypothetical protein PTSG_04157 [Salpingoeca rosetta]|uniref:NACHT domain-containing protein n=1 Tax=Salpingoeca rosetta (strain ATCC 50818 / BSB-021) TaxID=946362 RepID=F2U6S0_SALR5|nr:uncharacterized protein PTSG_04157 [Salpingoeca rosetta]EGD83552.1 hypothetical protein PTSG_04157 [Salpingoeca rosetta]|eukprot:XP_004995056.1 hypothetical protein PTSG_04157 [Salpingoeca rosetta]
MEAVVKGDVTAQDGLGSAQVRAFISSTFTDTVHERNEILLKVVPKVRAFAKTKGYDFSPATMRWGVTKAHANNHSHAELCIKEVKQCMKLSEGIAFISLLGQKFGFQPFPSNIEQGEFEKLVDALRQSDQDEASAIEQLERWFELDTNKQPAKYVLRPITDLHPAYGDDSRPDEARAASGAWWGEFDVMQKALRRACVLAGLPEDEQIKYLQSVTEDETRVGLKPDANATVLVPDINERVVWFKRTIANIEDKVGDPAAFNFVDVVDGQLDEGSQKRLNSVKDEFIPSTGLTNITEYTLSTWSPDKGVDPSLPEHRQYLDKLTADAEAALKASITKAAEKATALRFDTTFVEAATQARFCRERVETFYGREELVAKVTGYLEQDASDGVEPFVLYGRSGSGKTSILAKAAHEASAKYAKGGQHQLILRFIGTTSGSTTIVQLLQLICKQIRRHYGEPNPDAVKEELAELIQDFKTCLELATAEKPLMLFLDSLDQLSPEGGARQLRWLPAPTLPPHVHMVLSTLPEAKYECFPRLDAMYSVNFVEVVPLNMETDVPRIITSWCTANGRSLTDEQRSIVLAACKACPYPLYVRMALDETRGWKSTTPPDECSLKPDIQSIIDNLFEQLEVAHGKRFISAALGYITVTYRGLSDTELEDILSCNEEVLERIFEYWLPPQRRIPPLLWARVRDILGGFLVERGSGSTRVLSWHHRQFVEVARRRYCPEGSATAKQLASDVADHFLGKWAGKKKPFSPSPDQQKRFGLPAHDEADRLVTPQPLVHVSDDEFNWREHSQANIRKLEELPHVLAVSNRITELVELCLCNFDFLLLKMRCFGKVAVLSDFELISKHDTSGCDPHLLRAATLTGLSIRLAPADPEQLASQITGRLNGARANTYIDKLIAQIWASPYTANPTIVCLNACMDPPSASKRHVFGHPDKVRNFAINPTETLAAVACDDRKTYVWSLEDGEQVAILGPHDWMCRAVCFTQQGDRLITSSWSGQIKIWDVETWQELKDFMLKSEERNADFIERLCMAEDGKTLLSAAHDNRIHFIDLDEGEVKQSLELSGASECTVKGLDVHAKGHKIVAANERGTMVLFKFTNNMWTRACTTDIGHGASGCCFVADTDDVVVCDDSDVFRFKTSGGKFEQVWSTTLGKLLSVHADEQFVCASSHTGVLHVLDSRGKRLRQIESHTEWIDNCRVIGDNIYSCSQDRTVRAFKAIESEGDQDSDELDPPAMHSKDVSAVTGNNEYAFSCCGSDSFILQWDLATGSVVRRLPLDSSELTISADGRFLVGSFGTFEIATDTLQQGSLARSTYSGTIAHSLDGRYVLKTGIGMSDDTRVSITDLQTNRSVNSKLKHDKLIRAVVMSTDGTRVATVGDDGEAKIWSWPEQQLVKTVSLFRPALTTAISPDGTMMIAAIKGGLVYIIDLKSDRRLNDLEHFKADRDNYARLVISSTFSKDSRYALSGGRDRIVKVWDTQNGDCVAQATFEGGVDKMERTLDGAFVAGTQGGYVALFRLKGGKQTAPPKFARSNLDVDTTNITYTVADTSCCCSIA